MSANNNDIRSKILGNQTLRRDKCILWGQEVEVQQVTIGELIDASKANQEAGLDGDESTPMIMRMITQTYVPGTNEKVFDEGDVEMIKGLPNDGSLDRFYITFNGLAAIDVDEAEKNSDETSSS